MLKAMCAELERQLLLLPGGKDREPQLARALRDVAAERAGAQLDADPSIDDFAWRMAWLVFVLAPSLDESFIVTMPMRLEGIAEGRTRLTEVLHDILVAEAEAAHERTELAMAAAMHLRVPTAPASALRAIVRSAVRALRSDPTVPDRVIESIARESAAPPFGPPVEDSDAEVALALDLPSSRRAMA